MSNNTSRMWNLWTGFIALFVQNVESKNPEIVYQNSITSMARKYEGLKSAAGRVLARRDDIKDRRDTAAKSLVSVQAQLDAAVGQNDDEIAIILIQKKSGLESTLADLNEDLKKAVVEADDIKASMLAMKGQVDGLKAEKDVMLARLKSADARNTINASLEGFSTDADIAALSGVRDHIKGVVATANLGDEMRNSDLDVRLAKLQVTSGATNARSELDRLKAAKAGATSVAAANKTL